MLEAAGLQFFQKAVMVALIMASAYIALTIVRLLTPVVREKAPFGPIALKVLFRALIMVMLLVSVIPLSSKAPKAEMKIQSSASRAQGMQSRDTAPEVRQAAPAYERKADDTEELGRQIREDFENLPDAEIPPLSR